MNKEKKQVLLLVALLVVIAGVLVYFNRYRFIPTSGTAAPLPPALPQLMFDTGERESLFGRSDYLVLDEYVSPVDPYNVGRVGNDRPFRTLEVTEGE